MITGTAAHQARRRRGSGYLTLALACVTGAVALVTLLSRPNSGALTFRGFVVPAGVADGLEVRWARAYAKVEIPDNGWRPLHLTVQMRAAEAAARPGTRVTLMADDVPLQQVTVAPGWRNYEVTVTRAAAPSGRLALQLVSPTGDERGAGVGRVEVRSDLASAYGAIWGAVGALLGALLWLGFAVRAGGIAVPAHWRLVRVVDPPGVARVVSVAVAVAGLGIVIGTVGYTELGTRLFGAVWWIPSALGIDSALPWAQTLAAAPATLVHVVVIVALMTLPGWFVLASYPRLRPGGDAGDDALLAMPITVVLIGAALITLQCADVSNTGFTAVLFAAYGAIAVILAASREKREALVLFVRANRLFLLLQVLVPLCALFYLSVGLHDSGQIVDSTWAARRNLHTLPGDNELSWLASLTWRRHLPADALFSGLWRISDRGPLLAAAHSVLYRALDPRVEFFPHYLRLGIVLNGTFASAVFALVKRWSSSRVAWGCAALAALNPWNFLNVYYTWPKMFGAYFLIAAMVVLWNADRPALSRFVWCGVLFGLGALAHAGNLLSFPVFFLFTMAMYGRSLASWARLAAMPVALAITQIPWTVYKRLYSPDTFNLIIMHYLGEKNYFQPLSRRFQEFMIEHPWPEQIAVRKLSFLALWWNQLQWQWVGQWWLGRWDQGLVLQRLYPSEFFYPGHSVGLLWLPWIAVGAAVNVVFAVLARGFKDAAGVTRRLGFFLRPPAGQMRLGQAALALAFASVSLSLDTVLRWREPHSHELPYFELVLIGTIGLYVLRYFGLFYWLMAVVAIVIRQEQYFTLSAATTPLHLPAFDASGLLFWVTCALLIVPAFIVRDRRTSAQASDETAGGADIPARVS